MKMVLEHNGADEAIVTPEEGADLTRPEFKKKNLVAKLILTKHVPPNMQLLIQNYEYSHQMWSQLNELNEGTTGNRIANIFLNFFSDARTLTNEEDHVCKGEKFLQSLKQVKKTDEDLARVLTIMTLPPKHEHFRTVLYNSNESWEQIKIKIVDQGNQKNMDKGIIAAQFQPNRGNPPHLNQNQNKRFNNSNNNQNNRNNNSGHNNNSTTNTRQQSSSTVSVNGEQVDLCTYCNKIKHKYEDCRKRKKDQQQKAKKKNDKSPNPDQLDSFGHFRCMYDKQRGLTKTFNDSNLTSQSEEVTQLYRTYANCVAPTTQSHSNVNIDQNRNDQVCNIPHHNSDKQDGEIWFMDSGATQHATNDERNLTNFEPSTRTMSGANGSDINIKGVGYIPLLTNRNDTIVLAKCFYSPNLVGNFISVSRLTDTGHEILFRQDGCHVFKNGILIAEGFRIDDMYAIKCKKSPDMICVLQNTPSRQLSPEQLAIAWHRSLEHTNFDDLNKMKNILRLKNFERQLQCEVCAVAKCTSLPFEQSKTRPKNPLDIIHSDVSGIVRLPTVGNFNYFVTFIDGYSRYATIYLIKSKDEVFQKFKEYKAAV